MSRLFTLRYEPSGCLYIAGMVNVDNLAEREGLKGEASVDELAGGCACGLCPVPDSGRSMPRAGGVSPYMPPEM